MAEKAQLSTVIPHSYEEWRGADSVPRIRELQKAGLKLGAIAERFQVTRHTITRTLKKAPPDPVAV